MPKTVTSISASQVEQLAKYQDCASSMLVAAQRFRYDTEELLVDTTSISGEMNGVIWAIQNLSRNISASLEAVENLQYNIEEITDGE